MQEIIESFPFASNSEVSNKREMGLVKLLSHQEPVWEDFNTLKDVTVALYHTHDNQKGLKCLANLDFYTTLNVTSAVRSAEVSHAKKMQ